MNKRGCGVFAALNAVVNDVVVHVHTPCVAKIVCARSTRPAVCFQRNQKQNIGGHL